MTDILPRRAQAIPQAARLEDDEVGIEGVTQRHGLASPRGPDGATEGRIPRALEAEEERHVGGLEWRRRGSDVRPHGREDAREHDVAREDRGVCVAPREVRLGELDRATLRVRP